MSPATIDELERALFQIWGSIPQVMIDELRLRLELGGELISRHLWAVGKR
jgi:hypothetical protein